MTIKWPSGGGLCQQNGSSMASYGQGHSFCRGWSGAGTGDGRFGQLIKCTLTSTSSLSYEPFSNAHTTHWDEHVRSDYQKQIRRETVCVQSVAVSFPLQFIFISPPFQKSNRLSFQFPLASFSVSPRIVSNSPGNRFTFPRFQFHFPHFPDSPGVVTLSPSFLNFPRPFICNSPAVIWDSPGIGLIPRIKRNERTRATGEWDVAPEEGERGPEWFGDGIEWFCLDGKVDWTARMAGDTTMAEARQGGSEGPRRRGFGASRRDVTGSGIGDDLSSGNCPCPVVFGVLKDNSAMRVKIFEETLFGRHLSLFLNNRLESCLTLIVISTVMIITRSYLSISVPCLSCREKIIWCQPPICSDVV